MGDEDKAALLYRTVLDTAKKHNIGGLETLSACGQIANHVINALPQGDRDTLLADYIAVLLMQQGHPRLGKTQ